MAGLLEKDIRLLLRNRQLVIILVFVAFFISFSENLDIILPYMAVFGTIFSISTINYDETDNGFTYIMTLPVTHKDYVYEKYLFCTAGGLLSGFLALIFFILRMTVKGEAFDLGSLFTAFAVVIPMIVIVESLFIPFQLKFGNVNSRIIFMIFIWIIVAGAYVIDRFAGDSGQFITQLIKRCENIPFAAGIMLVSLFTVIILTVSIYCSIRIMKKKRY